MKGDKETKDYVKKEKKKARRKDRIDELVLQKRTKDKN